MQFIIKTVWIFLFIPFLSKAQSTYLPQGHKHQSFLNRIEIKLQKHPDLNVTTIKPLSRRLAVNAALEADSAGVLLSATDKNELNSLLLNNKEWVSEVRPEFRSKKSFLNAFYESKGNFLEVDQPDFYLSLNPVLQLQLSNESENDETVFVNTKGLTFRGLISRRIGFSAYLTDNQERPPLFVQEKIRAERGVPGAGFHKTFKKTGVDYFDTRGSIHFNVAKFLEFQFGYDKVFIGNGYRSLFLSDFGNSYLFLRINTRVWKLNYQNIFAELTPQYTRGGVDNLLDKKYVAMHHLSMNVTKWLNIGVFEAVSFGRTNHFEFSYLNPVIFLRVAEQQVGSFDNAMVGWDFKANIARKAQLYGQLTLDEFFLKEVRAGNGWWGNKYGLQAGGKYIDLFNIPNLDIQAEMNLIRPFTYSHLDTIANYTHYNQPLAHPLGANIVEAIGIVRYQPFPKWTGSVRVISWKQGLDTANGNIGVNIFKPNSTRSAEYGFTLPSGQISKGINAQFLVSYEMKENLFFEVAALIRKLRVEQDISRNRNSTVLSLAMRWNIFRREYDY